MTLISLHRSRNSCSVGLSDKTRQIKSYKCIGPFRLFIIRLPFNIFTAQMTRFSLAPSSPLVRYPFITIPKAPEPSCSSITKTSRGISHHCLVILIFKTLNQSTAESSGLSRSYLKIESMGRKLDVMHD